MENGQTWKTVKHGKRSNMENGQIWKTVKHGKRSNMENGQTWKTVKYGKWSNMENGQIWKTVFDLNSTSNWHLGPNLGCLPFLGIWLLFASRSALEYLSNMTFVYFWSQFLFWSLFHFRSRPHFIGNQILPPFTPSISAPPITSRYRRSLPILEKKHENPFLVVFVFILQKATFWLSNH